MEIPLPPSPPPPSKDERMEYSPSQVTSPQSDDDPRPQKMDSSKKMLSKQKVSNMIKSMKMTNNISFNVKYKSKVVNNVGSFTDEEKEAAKEDVAFEEPLAATVEPVPMPTPPPPRPKRDDVKIDSSNSSRSAEKSSSSSRSDKRSSDSSSRSNRDRERERDRDRDRDRERERKMNIDSIIEEEKKEQNDIAKKLSEMPKLDMMPNKAGSNFQRTRSAAGPVELDLINQQRAEEAAEKLARAQSMGIKYPTITDNFGFVTAQGRQETKEIKDVKRERDRRRTPSRSRSRSRGRSGGDRRRRPRSNDRAEAEERRQKSAENYDTELKKRFGVKEMPKTWKEMKSKNVSVIQADFGRLKRAFKDPAAPSIPGDKQCVLVKTHEDEVHDPTVVECEAAYQGLGRGVKVTGAIVHLDYKSLEFPAKSVQKTIAVPVIEWSLNKKSCLHGLYKGRNDCPETEKAIKDLIKGAKFVPMAKDQDGDDTAAAKHWYVKAEDFLDPTATGAIFWGAPPAKATAKKTKKAKKKLKTLSTEDILDILEAEGGKKSKKAKKAKKKAKTEDEDAAEVVKKKKKKKKQKEDSASPVKKAKKKAAKKAKMDLDALADPADLTDLDVAPATAKPLTSKLMSMAGYNEDEAAVQEPLPHLPQQQHGRKRKREDPRSPSPPPSTAYKRPSSSSKTKRPRTPPEPSSVSPPTDPRLRVGPPRPSGPRTPSPAPRSRTGPRTPSPRPKSPPAASPQRYQRPPSPPMQRRRSRSPSPRYRGRTSPRRGRSSPPPRGSPSRGGRRSPSPLSPNRSRLRSPSPRYRRPRSPGYRGRGGRSPSPGSPRYSRSRYSDSSSFRLERSVADSTISDADLLRPNFLMDPSIPPPVGGAYYPPDAAGLLSDGFRQNSPKRPSLDERLEKELGIKVRDDLGQVPDLSRPPPGYPRHLGVKLGHVPQYQTPNADPKEEGRLVRVGNMLQIVPEQTSVPRKVSPKPVAVISTPPTTTTASTLIVPPPKAAIVPVVAAQEESKAKELMRKLEEQKKKKEAEKRQRREQRLAEQQKKQLTEAAAAAAAAAATLVDPVEVNNGEKEQKAAKAGRILETIEREEDQEARILAEAITSVPEDDNDDDADNHNMDIQGMSAERRYKSKKKDEVRYISLKPLSKKERKRQQKIASEAAATAEEASEPVEDLDYEAAAEEEFVKRSPVPLPDASTIKPILHQFGYAKDKKESGKKVLRYADGVLPGQGSPDHHNAPSEPSPPPPSNR
jgi:hypothetical protein